MSRRTVTITITFENDEEWESFQEEAILEIIEGQLEDIPANVRPQYDIELSSE